MSDSTEIFLKHTTPDPPTRVTPHVAVRALCLWYGAMCFEHTPTRSHPEDSHRDLGTVSRYQSVGNSPRVKGAARPLIETPLEKMSVHMLYVFLDTRMHTYPAHKERKGPTR